MEYQNKDIDILFLKVNKSKPNMYFDNFVKFLYELAQIKYCGEPTDVFRMFLDNHIFPQCEAILKVKHKNREIKEDKMVTKLFGSIINVLYDIYQAYFTFKIKKSFQDSKVELQRCEKSLFKFLRDFEIFPVLINKSKVYSLWTQVTEKSIDGRSPIYKSCVSKLSKNYDIRFENALFSFGFFLDFLALIALTAYVEDDQVFQKVTVAESVVLLLERMELSKGFKNFGDKMHSDMLPPNHIVQAIVKDREKENHSVDQTTTKTQQTTRSSQVLWKDSKDVREESKYKRFNEDIDSSESRGSSRVTKTLSQDYDVDVSEMMPSLKRIFQYYCSYGEPTNSTKLKSSKFIKLLKDANI